MAKLRQKKIKIMSSQNIWGEGTLNNPFFGVILPSSQGNIKF